MIEIILKLPSGHEEKLTLEQARGLLKELEILKENTTYIPLPYPTCPKPTYPVEPYKVTWGDHTWVSDDTNRTYAGE